MFARLINDYFYYYYYYYLIISINIETVYESLYRLHQSHKTAKIALSLLQALLRTSVDTVRFLPLDEAIASRSVFVIIPGSDRQVDGRQRFWIQLNNSKTVRDRP